jgi:hypothetical protein
MVTVTGRIIYDWCMSSDYEPRDIADEWFQAKEESYEWGKFAEHALHLGVANPYE